MVDAMEIQEGYKQTEVGAIPSDWEVKPLSEIFEVTAGGDFKRELSSNFKNELFPYPIYSNSLTNFGLYGYASYYTCDSNAITVTARGTIGNANYRNHKFTAIGRVIVLKPKNEIDCFFVSEYINNRVTFVLEVTGVPQLTAPQISKYRIALPPTKAEQTAIATALNDADALITQLEKLVAKKRAIKQGAMQELLKPKDGWKVFDFKNIFRKLNAKRQQIQTKEYQQSGKYPVIDQGKQKVVAYSDNSSKVFSCPNDGLIVFGDHTREIKFVDYDFIVGADGTQLITVNKEHSIKFFFYQLLLKEVPNTGYNRHFKFLLEMEFIIPDKIEQTRIAQTLSDMDAEIEALEKKLDKYKMLKQGMMQNLLTGRIRLV